MKLTYNHIGLPSKASFSAEIPLPHLKVTVSDHQNNPFGIQWQRYDDDAPYPEVVKNNATWRSRLRMYSRGSKDTRSSSNPTAHRPASSSRLSKSTVQASGRTRYRHGTLACLPGSRPNPRTKVDIPYIPRRGILLAEGCTMADCETVWLPELDASC
jgi:hypothetical protein